MYQYQARLVSVTDGDTVRLDLDLGFHSWRLNRPYRLLRINAPEMRGDEREAGQASTDALAAYLADKALMVATQKPDSFGRWLIELYANGENVSDWLVDSGLARYHEY